MRARTPTLLLLAALASACDAPKLGRVATGARPVPEMPSAARPLRVCGHQRDDVAARVDASVLLVVDRSSSMAQGSRWSQTVDAVAAALGAYDRYLRFGLLMYPSEPDACAAVDEFFDVPPALGNGDVISAAMADAEIMRGTPTGAALRAAAALMASDRSEHRVVVLATDGNPDCTAQGWDNGSGLASSEAYDAADALAEGGVPVYVVGIQGSSGARAVLNRIADIGGTARPGDIGYYETASGAELAAALVDIALDLDGCALKLDAPDGAVQMFVALDGEPLANDPTHGWELQEQLLRIHGAACLAAPGESHTVEVTWYCE